jgi:AMP nucleosidase
LPLIEVAPSLQEIPYPYVLERGDAFDGDTASGASLARHFPSPSLADVGDEVADSLWHHEPGRPQPLALFDAVRVDYSLRRLIHYTGTDWRHVQPWILLTNYHRYVDQFVRWGLAELASAESPYDRLVLPGGVEVASGENPAVEALVASTAWHRYQMPAYHLLRRDGAGGVTLVNIGVGPSNAKNITDHLAVLRPHCWLMVGHCAGLIPARGDPDS